MDTQINELRELESAGAHVGRPDGAIEAALGRLREREHELQTAADQLRRRERELQAVYDITAALHRRTTVDELERLTLDTARLTVNADAGSILIYDAEKERLLFKYVINPEPAVVESLMKVELRPGQGIAGSVFREGEVRVTLDTTVDDQHRGDIDELTGYKSQNIVTVPLKTTDEQTIGVMQILNKRGADFDDGDVAVLRTLAIHAASAIETARLREEAAKAVVVNLIGDISHDVKNMITPAVTGNQTLELMLKGMFEDMDVAMAGGATTEDMARGIRAASDMVREFFPEVMEMTYDAATQVQERVREIADAIKGIVSDPHFEPVWISDVAEAVAGALRILAERAGIRIDLTGLGETPQVEMDRKRMYNALYNLINNAIPETPDGGSISVGSRVVRVDGRERLEVVVRDTGRGMPPEVRERLFTEHAVSTKVGGTGLGTRIVKNVVDAHHGTIRVDSAPGEGTAFIIHLPVVQPEAESG